MQDRETKRQTLRSMVRGAYDIQALRIQMGGRIVANFKAKLGQEPGEKEDELSDDAKALLKDLRVRFKKLTDGVKTFPKYDGFEGDEIISTYTELCLIAQYVSLEASETQHFRRLGTVLQEFPIYEKFLKDVRGVGPAMAGVILSEFDIHKAAYPSSLWAYAGLDAVGQWVLRDTRYLAGDKAAAERWVADGNVRESKPLEGYNDPKNTTFTEDGPELSVRLGDADFSLMAIYRMVCTGGRSRRKEHLREVKYIDKNGKPATKVGITFNPWLKTKLVGVLAGSFLKCGDSPYATCYYDYKHRMESHAKYGIENDKAKNDDARENTSKGRRHNMALRYAVKMFLIDLYKVWRELEGLPVAKPYHEAKLGLEHRKAG